MNPEPRLEAPWEQEDDNKLILCNEKIHVFPVGNVSPLSVAEMFPEQDEWRPRHKGQRRGIDSPMKPVETRNIYRNDSCGEERVSVPVPPSATHRRQNTADSTNSKVAAVQRGVNKAAEEELIVDRPVACPKRQQTGGSENNTTNNTQATRRPPLHRVHANSDRASDRPVPYPKRQPTLQKKEKPCTSASIIATPERQSQLTLTPKALIANFERQASKTSTTCSSTDTRDDTCTSTSSQVIQAWLSMPTTLNCQTPNSAKELELQLAVTPMTPKPTTSLVLFNTPQWSETESDTATTANDASFDDRMFQAFLKLPPRACTTPNLSLPLFDASTNTPKLQTPVTTTSRTPFVPRSIVGTPNLCVDVSGIEMSLDLSLPSFFGDCRAEINESIMPTKVPIDTSRIPNESTSTRASLSLAGLAVQTDLQRRQSLPPHMPHRRKPSLQFDQDEEEITTKVLWSSMPIVLPSLPPQDTNSQQDKRPSWRSESEAIMSPPTIPKRFRRQDSLLPSEANCDTMVPPQTPIHATEPRRASAPPLKPHRRKPSLHLKDLTTLNAEEERCNQDYNASQTNLWSSLPNLSSANLTARKPSLNILEDGPEGRIEIWLSEAQQQTKTNNNKNERRYPQRQDSFCSIESIILKEGEMEI